MLLCLFAYLTTALLPQVGSAVICAAPPSLLFDLKLWGFPGSPPTRSQSGDYFINVPLVQIHVLRSAKRSSQDLRLLADTIQDEMRSHFNAPPRDRYQIIIQHDEGEVIYGDRNLPGLPRSNKLVFLQICRQGSDAKTVQAV